MSKKKDEIRVRRLLTNCIDMFCNYDLVYNKTVDMFGNDAKELNGIAEAQSCIIVRIRKELDEFGVERKFDNQIDYMYWLNGVLRSGEDSQTKAKYLVCGRKENSDE